jgi:hypothetical protein
VGELEFNLPNVTWAGSGVSPSGSNFVADGTVGSPFTASATATGGKYSVQEPGALQNRYQRFAVHQWLDKNDGRM